MNRTDAEVVPGVTFEVERFEWTADGRLALVGRWFGLRGHRFLRPTLDVNVSGERRRMLADLEHKPWAAEDGQQWVAEFGWMGAPAHFQDAELTVSPDLAVQLPQPDNSVPEADVPSRAESLPARPPRTALLEAELAAAAEELRRVTGELTNLRDEHAETRQAAAAELEKVKKEHEAAAAAHAEALGTVQREREEARERLAAVEQERDEVRERLAAAEAERQAAADARDEARAERNAWMSRASAAALPPAPAPDAQPPAPESEPPAPELGAPESGAPAAESGAPESGAPAAKSGAAASESGAPESGAPESPGPESERPAPPAEPPRSDPRAGAAPESRTNGEPERRARKEPERRASKEPAPRASEEPDPPRQERRTIRIGERPFPAPPGPVHAPLHQGRWRRFLDAWGARLAALAALIVFLAVVALVLTWAL
jgi:hypothetical protein